MIWGQPTQGGRDQGGSCGRGQGLAGQERRRVGPKGWAGAGGEGSQPWAEQAGSYLGGEAWPLELRARQGAVGVEK